MRTQFGFEIRWLAPFQSDWHRLGRPFPTAAEAARLLSIVLEIAVERAFVVEGRIIRIHLPDDIETDMTNVVSLDSVPHPV